MYKENIKTVNIWGFSLISDNISKIRLSSETKIISTISPNSYGISTKDSDFRKSLKNCDFLVLDGVYFALASILLKGKNIKKNQGPDIFNFFINKMNKEKGKVFFLGSSKETLDKIKNRLKNEYPNINAEFLPPPFKPEFSQEENDTIVKVINNFKPDILFVGMTCPKQEKWAYQNQKKLNAKLVFSIGAVFDWYAGNQKEIHPLWWKLRLAWLKRMIDRPEILKRFPTIGIFFLHLFYALIGIKKYKNGTF